MLNNSHQKSYACTALARNIGSGCGLHSGEPSNRTNRPRVTGSSESMAVVQRTARTDVKCCGQRNRPPAKSDCSLPR